MNDIIKSQNAGLAVASNQRGFEAPGFTQEDLIMPRAKLLQALSPEIQDGGEGLSQGNIINSITQEKLPEEFIPIFAFKNYARFNPRKKEDPNFNSEFAPGELIWKSSDPEDFRVQAETVFGPNGETPLAVTFLNFFSYFPGANTPLVVSFSKTSYKAGKQLLSMAKWAGGDMFSRKYKLTTHKESNDSGTYFVLRVAVLGENTEHSATCEKLWTDFSFKAQNIQVHMDETE